MQQAATSTGLRLTLAVPVGLLTPAAGGGEVQAVVGRVRSHALELLRTQIAVAFGDAQHSPVTDRLARFGLAAFDGAFLASQSGPDVTLERLLQPLVPSLAAARRELLGGAMAPAKPAGGTGGAPGKP